MEQIQVNIYVQLEDQYPNIYAVIFQGYETQLEILIF